jgi:hypothetical protein
MATTAQRTNLEVVESAYEGFNSGDIESVLARFHDDIEWTVLEGSRYGGSYHGPDAVAEEVFAGTATDYEGFQATPPPVRRRRRHDRRPRRTRGHGPGHG